MFLFVIPCTIAVHDACRITLRSASCETIAHRVECQRQSPQQTDAMPQTKSNCELGACSPLLHTRHAPLSNNGMAGKAYHSEAATANALPHLPSTMATRRYCKL